MEIVLPCQGTLLVLTVKSHYSSTETLKIGGSMWFYTQAVVFQSKTPR